MTNHARAEFRHLFDELRGIRAEMLDAEGDLAPVAGILVARADRTWSITSRFAGETFGPCKSGWRG